jgi:cytochrome P450
VSQSVQRTCPVRNFDHWDQSQTLLSLRPTYTDMLTGEPVTWSDTYGGFWILSHYADVKAAAANHGLFSSGQGVCLPPLPPPRSAALEQDPPDHTPFRKLFAEWLSPRVVRTFNPMISELTEHYVTEFAANGGGDFVAEVSAKLPVQIIVRTLGIESGRAHEFYVLSDLLTRVDNDPPERAARFADLLRACSEEIEGRRADPRDDFLTEALSAQFDGRPITDEELLLWLSGAIFAGHETTLLAGAALIRDLSLDPGLRERLRREPDRIPTVVDESLRINSPVQRFFRTLTADVTMHGVTMRTGDKVMLNFASANIDGQVFTDPLTLQPDRAFTRHLGFGWGLHRCVGSPLASRELETLARTMVTLTEFEPDGEPEFAGATALGSFIGLAKLPINCRLR